MVAMEMAWRFLKSSSISESGMGMDGLDEDGNYKDVTDTRQFRPSVPIEATNQWNMRPRQPKPVISEAERLANQGFTAENINRIKMQNAAARAAMNRGLHQPKGG